MQDSAPLLDLDLPLSTGADTTFEEAEITRRLASMPLFERETYLLRVVDGMSIDEISVRLAISRRATRRYLERAIIILAATPEL